MKQPSASALCLLALLFSQNLKAEPLPAAVLGSLSTLVSAVLPSSRSVEIGSTATFFAVMSNAGNSPETGCRVSPSIGPLGAFDFVRTDPNTNELVGGLDERFDLAAGATQTLLLAVTPSVEIDGVDVPLTYICDSGATVDSIVGINTLLLSATTFPVADVVGITTVVDLVAPQGETALFAVASVNLGITDNITVSLETGAAALPANLSLCRTDPDTGACSGDIGAQTTLTYAEGEFATFAVFVEPTDTIAADPVANRIFIRFRDSAGNIRGGTTTAVRTQ